MENQNLTQLVFRRQWDVLNFNRFTAYLQAVTLDLMPMLVAGPETALPTQLKKDSRRWKGWEGNCAKMQAD